MTALDTGVIVAYLLGIAALGWLAGRNKRLQSTADFFLGSKNFPWWIVGTSMVATDLGGLGLAAGAARVASSTRF